MKKAAKGIGIAIIILALLIIGEMVDPHKGNPNHWFWEKPTFVSSPRTYRTDIVESDISKTPLWEHVVEKRELAIAEAERIAERNAIVESAVYNYTTNAITQSYIFYAWEQFEYYGWSAYDLECLITLWHRESQWSPLAHNSTSGAHGIPQSLPAEKMARFGDDYWDNGYTQILWGLWYIWQRYGNPASALSHSYATGWY